MDSEWTTKCVDQAFQIIQKYYTAEICDQLRTKEVIYDYQKALDTLVLQNYLSILQLQAIPELV